MHPAPSIIIFTVLSGFGFGLLFHLGVAQPEMSHGIAFLVFAFAAGMATVGLVVSVFHLGHPERALKAFTQWRSSWLSREAWISSVTLVLAAIFGGGQVFLGQTYTAVGYLMAFGCVLTVFSTSMIYGQLKTVPRWSDWTTPVIFILAALAGPELLNGHFLPLVVFGAVQIAVWYRGDSRFSESGHTIGTATGLGDRGAVRAFEPPHTGTNYLLNEMVHVVGRTHAMKLRMIGILLAALVPVALLLICQGVVIVGMALLSHICGLLMIRWLFFAEAEHVVGLYYGNR